jgi:hypothetical protein
MSAAVKRVVALDSMSDDFAPAMRALGSQRMDRALEAVERMRPASEFDLERFIIFVPTSFASSHFVALPFIKGFFDCERKSNATARAKSGGNKPRPCQRRAAGGADQLSRPI